MARQECGSKKAGGFQKVIWSTQLTGDSDRPNGSQPTQKPWRGREKNGMEDSSPFKKGWEGKQVPNYKASYLKTCVLGYYECIYASQCF